jgi:hypothetical protein
MGSHMFANNFVKIAAKIIHCFYIKDMSSACKVNNWMQCLKTYN